MSTTFKQPTDADFNRIVANLIEMEIGLSSAVLDQMTCRQPHEWMVAREAVRDFKQEIERLKAKRDVMFLQLTGRFYREKLAQKPGIR